MGTQPESEIDVISASLAVCAERSGDIVPEVYKRFFAQDPTAQALMAHSDEHMLGRMMEAVLDLFMSDEPFGCGNYLEWELDNHLEAYAARPGMYAHFLEALRAVVEDGNGAGWEPAHAQAWDARVARIMSQVEAHAERIGAS